MGWVRLSASLAHSKVPQPMPAMPMQLPVSVEAHTKAPVPVEAHLMHCRPCLVALRRMKSSQYPSGLQHSSRSGLYRPYPGYSNLGSW
jgi:hypothetical protein